MSKISTLCFLRSLASSHPDIPLPHNQEVVLGRGPQTKITDSRLKDILLFLDYIKLLFRCSRKQLSFVADCDQCRVRVTQLGLNTSQANNKDIGVQKTAILKHEELLSFLSDQYKYKLLFNPPPTVGFKSDFDANESVDKSYKRQISDSEMSVKKK